MEKTTNRRRGGSRRRGGESLESERESTTLQHEWYRSTHNKIRQDYYT